MRRAGSGLVTDQLPRPEQAFLEENHGGGLVTLEDVIAFGSRACRTAAARREDQHLSVAVTGVDARLFDTGPVETWQATAERLNDKDGSSVWHVRIFAGPSRLAAIATFHLRVEAVSATKPDEEGPEALLEEGEQSSATPEPAAMRRRSQIAAAACDVIARKGFANATMREIASASGLHVPTMYQYVTSKDEMLELVYRWIMDSVRTDVLEAADPHTTAADQLRAVIAAMIRRGDRFRHRIGVLNRELKSLSPAARRRVITEYRGLLEQIAGLIQGGIDAGEFRPIHPTIAANLVDAVCDIWPLRPFAVGHLDAELFAAQVTEFVLQGLRR